MSFIVTALFQKGFVMDGSLCTLLILLRFNPDKGFCQAQMKEKPSFLNKMLDMFSFMAY
jgi:hypothetical protein